MGGFRDNRIMHMKFLFDWLKNILSGEKLVAKETGKSAIGFENVVVGRILEIQKHPNADRLQITKTDVGGEILQIVCGAKNIEVGQKVPVALVGAKLPNGLEIREAQIRGEKSFGMLCAKDELGLGVDHSGIFILDKNAEVGMKFAKYINLNK
ncbi:MAG: EMAP domain-containing protein [Parcubacteria group bacterium Athens0714_25]|nr:MAG: EMAP domain-containing protein [Parcubacteria group bacterium Athens0714_25]